MFFYLFVCFYPRHMERWHSVVDVRWCAGLLMSLMVLDPLESWSLIVLHPVWIKAKFQLLHRVSTVTTLGLPTHCCLFLICWILGCPVSFILCAVSKWDFTSAVTENKYLIVKSLRLFCLAFSLANYKWVLLKKLLLSGLFWLYTLIFVLNVITAPFFYLYQILRFSLTFYEL